MTAPNYAGCHTLDLYCTGCWGKNYIYRASTYTGETFAECAKEAKEDGWIINKKK